MAKYSSIDNVISVNGVDLSDCLESVNLPEEVAVLITTNFATGGYETSQAGIRKFDVTLGFFQDFSASKWHATVRPLLGLNTTVVVKPRNTTVAATNPQFTLTVLVSKIDNLPGGIGQMGKGSLTWPGQGAPVVATS